MAGLTIDKLDIGVYIQYARRTQLIEQVRQQYHLREATSVPAQALIVDLYPKLSELDLLLGVPILAQSWAYFYAPKSYVYQRRSPFLFHKIFPALNEKQEQNGGEGRGKRDEEKLEEVVCTNEEETKEKNALQRCFKQIEEINSLLRYIGGRIGQFLQG